MFMVFSTIPPHRLSYFTIVVIEEIRLVSLLLLLLKVVSNTFAIFELGCLRLRGRAIFLVY